MNIPPELLNLLKDEESYLIAAHVSPDGDAIGSSIALSMALESMGKKTVVYDKDPVPEFYKFLPGQERFTNSIPGLNPQISNLVLIDCNELERTSLENIVIRHSVVIDHHETIREFGDIKWIDPHAAATGMMVYYLIKELGLKMTKDMATNLYTAIAVDTGTFRYSNTTHEVLSVSADLIDSGADPARIAVEIYETWSERRFRLLTMALNTLDRSGSVAMLHVTREMFAETGASPEDTENFVSFPRMMKEVKVAVLFREIESGKWKVSLRSRGDVNVSKIAEAFNGGGHRNAAGYKVKGDLKTAKEELFKAVMRIAKQQAASNSGGR